MSEKIPVHLNVPGPTKGRWVYASRASSQRLSDYIVKAVEAYIVQEIASLITEAATLAEEIADMPVAFKYQQVMEGATAMQQAAAAFHAATDQAARLDAALWMGEAYLLMSSGLPDAGHNEQSTGWATARQIAVLLGGPDRWEARVRNAFEGRHD